jgi:hypothetical protein
MTLSLGAMGNLLRRLRVGLAMGIGPWDRAAQEGTAMVPERPFKKFMLDAKAIVSY